MALLDIEFLVDNSSFSPASTFPPFLLAFLVSDQKSDIKVTEDSLRVMGCFSLAVFKFLPLFFAFQQFDWNMSPCGSP